MEHPLAEQLLASLAEHHTLAAWQPAALRAVCQASQVPSARLVLASGGSFHTVASGSQPGKNSTAALPTDVLAEALDRNAIAKSANWTACPLAPATTQVELLLLEGVIPVDRCQTLIAQWQQAARVTREREQIAGRADRLAALLQITQTCADTQQLETLLNRLAKAAMQLIGTDRASIFLWDRSRRQLVGRPAVGLPNGELRIADDAGIVGQVVQTGAPRRVNTSLDGQEIDRSVDRSTGYQTHSLLCVPLRNAAGDIIGAFEVINKLQGMFDGDDEQALTELAAYATVEIESTRQFEQLLSQHKQLIDQAASRVQLLGESPAMQQLRATVSRVANTDLAVLILGENGAGKEVVAQSIHYQSARRDHPFVAVNCAAIAETLLESELFGHEQGAFTDARESRQGKFELASGGTLFLDEIGDMSPAGQAKLLRVLEEKTVVRVGGSKPIAVDVRIIAATNQDLAKLVGERRFRQDLFFRLNVVTLTLPSLRDRAEDVLPLAEHFLTHFCRQAKRPTLKLSRAASETLVKHRWPGNVRELRNLIERVAYLCPNDTITPEDLSLSGRAADSASMFAELADKPLAEATDQFQTAHIKQMIARASGNMSTAADRLGLHRTNLYRKMRQLGIDAQE